MTAVTVRRMRKRILIFASLSGNFYNSEFFNIARNRRLSYIEAFTPQPFYQLLLCFNIAGTDYLHYLILTFYFHF